MITKGIATKFSHAKSGIRIKGDYVDVYVDRRDLPELLKVVSLQIEKNKLSLQGKIFSPARLADGMGVVKVDDEEQ